MIYPTLACRHAVHDFARVLRLCLESGELSSRMFNKISGLRLYCVGETVAIIFTHCTATFYRHVGMLEPAATVLLNKVVPTKHWHATSRPF